MLKTVNWRRGVHISLVFALLALQGALAVTAMRGKSCTLDETLHIGSGLRHLYWGDGNTSIGDPTFPRFVAALAVAVQGVDVELPTPTEPASTHTDLWDFGTRILHRLPGPDGSVLDNDGRRIVVAARYGIVALMLGLSLAVYGLARDLMGPTAALFSMALCALSPNILAHGTLVTTDIAATLGFVGTVWAFWRLTQRLTWANLIMALGFSGILLCSKITALAVVPILAITALARLIRTKTLAVRLWRRDREVRRFAGRAAILAAALALCPPLSMGVMYGFYTIRHLVPGTTTNTSSAQAGAAGDAPPTPDEQSTSEQIAGLVERARQAYRSDRTHPAFLDGRISKTGFRSYFPLAFIYKSSPATHAALLVALCLLVVRAVSRRKQNADQQRAYRGGWLPVGAFLAMYAVMSINTTMNIGLRHILPIYGFLFVAVGVVGRWAEFSRIGRVAAVAVALLAVGTSLSAHPHYLAYFGPVAGGSRNGHRHLVDSNIDWGQDMLLLADYAKQRGLDIVNLSRYGSDNPDAYGMNSRSLICYMEYKPHPLIDYKPGTYAVSATMLQALYYVELDDGPTTPEWTDALERRWQALKPLYADYMALRGGRIAPHAFLLRHAEALGIGEPTLAAVAGRDRRSVLEEARPLVARFGTMTFVKFMAALRDRQPTTVLGHSIFVYDLDAADLKGILTP